MIIQNHIILKSIDLKKNETPKKDFFKAWGKIKSTSTTNNTKIKLTTKKINVKIASFANSLIITFSSNLEIPSHNT